MYKELLTQLIQPFPSAKIQPPCSEAELAQAEAVVGYPFPEELKALLRELNGDRWLLLSAQRIAEHVRTNREIFPDCFDDPQEYYQTIDRHIFFATNGCGDYYCYRVSPEGIPDPTQIYLWEHETFESHPVARDLTDLITKYYHDEV